MTIIEDVIGTNNAADKHHGIYGNQSQSVFFKPIFGLLNQPKYLPMKKMGGLSIELELNDNFLDATVDPDKVEASTPEKKKAQFVTGNTSTAYQLENVMVKVDLITLDNNLQNSYDGHLLAGNAYPINLNTYINLVQNVIGPGSSGQEKINLLVSRAITRLKSVFITLDKEVLYDKN